MSLIRNFATVLSGRLTAQILTILAMPILARLYTPEDFGAVSLLTALIQVPAALYMWRYEQAIPQAKDQQEASGLFILSLFIACTHTGIIYIILYCIPQSWITQFLPTSLLLFFYLLPLLLLVQAMASLFRQWAAYCEYFIPGVWSEVMGCLTRRYLPMSLVNLFPINAWGLLCGLFLAPIIRISVFLYYFMKDLLKFKFYQSRFYIQLAKTYKNFPLYLSWISLLELGSLSLPAVILTYYYGLEASGWYGQAYALLLVPINLLAQSSGRVFYPRLAKIHHQDPEASSQLVKQVCIAYFDLTFYPLCALAIIAPDLWSWVLGEAFAPSGIMAQALIPYMMIASIWSPMSVIVNVLHLQSALLKYTLSITVVRSIALWVGAHYSSMYMAILAYALSATIIRCWQFAWLLRQINVNVSELLKVCALRIIYILPVLALLLYACDETSIIYQLMYCGLGALVIMFSVIKHYPTLGDTLFRKNR